MTVLKATEEQYHILNGYQNGVNKLIFVKDGNNNWIVGTEVKTDPNFQVIWSILDDLEPIDYIPVVSE